MKMNLMIIHQRSGQYWCLFPFRPIFNINTESKIFFYFVRISRVRQDVVCNGFNLYNNV